MLLYHAGLKFTKVNSRPSISTVSSMLSMTKPVAKQKTRCWWAAKQKTPKKQKTKTKNQRKRTFVERHLAVHLRLGVVERSRGHFLRENRRVEGQFLQFGKKIWPAPPPSPPPPLAPSPPPLARDKSASRAARGRATAPLQRGGGTGHAHFTARRAHGLLEGPPSRRRGFLFF